MTHKKNRNKRKRESGSSSENEKTPKKFDLHGYFKAASKPNKSVGVDVGKGVCVQNTTEILQTGIEQSERSIEYLKNMATYVDDDAVEPDAPSVHEMFRIISSDIKQIKADIGDLKSALTFNSEEIEDMKKEMSQLKLIQSEQSGEIRCLKNELAKLKSAQVNEKAYSMRNNLLIRNVKSDEKNLETNVRQVFKEMKITDADSIPIERIHRMSKDNDKSPVIVRFSSFRDRAKVWGSVRELKTTPYSMDEHFPAEIVANRRILYPIFRQIRNNKEQIKMVKDCLYYKGKSYTVDNISELIQSTKTLDAGATVTEEVYAFFGRTNPLSNFYTSTFSYKNKDYACGEMAYQCMKAQFNGRTDVAEAIQSMQNPVDMKRAGDRLPDEKWYGEGHAIQAMSAIAEARVSQCEMARECLRNTQSRRIAEASPKDGYWGIALNRWANEVKSPMQWKGSNHLGNIYENLRQKLMQK